MKLRVRYKGATKVLSLTDHPTPTVQCLCICAEEEFGLAGIEYELSLNGKDPLGEKSLALEQLGLVSGDLLKILSTEPSIVQETSCATDSIIEQEQSTSGVEQLPTTSGTSHATTCDTPSRSDLTSSEAMDVSDEHEVNRYLREPVLIRDAVDNTVPHTLACAMTGAVLASANDLVCLVFHVLMIESGYSVHTELPTASQSSADDNSTEMYSTPSDWKQGGIYSLRYVHVNCDRVIFTLTCVPIGRLIMIHGSCEEGQKDTQILTQLKLHPSDYVHPDMSLRFQNLPRLSRLFKDHIAYPLLQRVREALDLPPIQGLLALPKESQIHIVQHLNIRSLCLLMQTCSNLQAVCRDPVLWRRLYLKMFGRRQNNDLSQNWYQFYKERHATVQQQRSMLRQMQYPRHPGSVPLYIPIPGPVSPPGYIGGDYDLYPGIGGPIPRHPFLRPRFDPFGPRLDQRFRPGRGGGMWDPMGGGRGGFGPRSGFGGFGPRFL